MPVPFSCIPFFIQVQIIEKMRLKDVVALEESSKVASIAIRQVKAIDGYLVDCAVLRTIRESLFVRFNDKLKYIGVSDPPQFRFVAKIVKIEDRLNDAVLGKILEFVRKSGTTFSELKLCFFTKIGVYSPAALHELLKTGDVRTLTFQEVAHMEFLTNLPENVTKVSFKWFDANDVLRKVKVPEIQIEYTKIDDLDLNLFLKEWVYGKRKIDHLLIKGGQARRKELILDGIPHSTTFHPNLYKLYRGRSDVLYVKINDRGTVEAASAIYNISNLH